MLDLTGDGRINKDVVDPPVKTVRNLSVLDDLDIIGLQEGTGIKEQPDLPVVAPKVVGVFVNSSSWEDSYRDALMIDVIGGEDGYMIPTGSISQFETLSWGNLDQISIRFSHDVEVQQADLQLLGVSIESYEFLADDTTDIGPADQDGFRYDDSTFTATWTLDKVLDNDRLTLSLSDSVTRSVTRNEGAAIMVPLDGEWTDTRSTFVTTDDNVRTGSGDGIAGGSFEFRFNALAGDAYWRQCGQCW